MDDRKMRDLQADNEYLQSQIDQYRRDEEDRRDAMEEDRKARRRQSAEALLHADTWREAFGKNGYRYKQEAAEEAAYIASLPEGETHESFFADALVVNGRAARIYAEEETNLRKQMMTRIIQRLREEFPDNDHAEELIKFLEADDPGGYVYW